MRLKIPGFKDSIYKDKTKQTKRTPPKKKTVQQCTTMYILGVHFKNKYISRAVKSERALSG